MILGLLDHSRPLEELKQVLLAAVRRACGPTAADRAAVWSVHRLALCTVQDQGPEGEDRPQAVCNGDGSVVLVFEGRLYNRQEIADYLGWRRILRRDTPGELILHLYEESSPDFLNRVNGDFVFALWDQRRQRLTLGRDRLGILPLFYSRNGTGLAFSSSLHALLETGVTPKTLNRDAVLQYLLYCYNPGDHTLIQNVYKVPPAHLLSWNGSEQSATRYWRLSFAETETKGEQRYREEILSLLSDAIRIRLDAHRGPGIFLSGGTDSSAIVSLASQMAAMTPQTFSFWCAGPSYDESHYARMVAARYGTRHTEIPYSADDLFLLSRVVGGMDEPFCDIGIEIGTYLLGRAAGGAVSYVLSGEGGDELFGGHPVYIANKVAEVTDRLPPLLTRPLAWALQQLPDSDRKKNLRVKLKRFAYSLAFPPALLAHRWRVYYQPQELEQLCTPDFLTGCDLGRLFDPILRSISEADGRDTLSRSLYSDFQTLVGFYLRRLNLLREFLLHARLPLLDHRLVEYAARIPSRLKVRGLSETKYLYRRVLNGVLPREIVQDRPKLGHGVPMKNWLRDSPKVQEWIRDVLSEDSMRRRGFFHTQRLDRMLDEHLRKTHNHSHRLWGLAVLELWLRKVLDGTAG